MGQYHQIVNLTKHQYLNPHHFGDGIKLLEFGCGSCGAMTALALLLSDSNGRGGGDLEGGSRNIVGSWAGDKIVVTGDYGDPHQWFECLTKAQVAELKKLAKDEGIKYEALNLYSILDRVFTDVSSVVRKEMEKDEWIADNMSPPIGMPKEN